MACAERRLTLTAEQERMIHALCTEADSTVWAIKFGDEKQREMAAGRLAVAWMNVSHEVMP